MERTLIIATPDAMQRGIGFKIFDRMEQRGYKVTGLKLMAISDTHASEFYHEHKGKPFFQRLVEDITSAPVIIAVFEGSNVVKCARGLAGPTDPSDAVPGSIRGDFAIERGRNLVHCSDRPKSAELEIALFFTKEELVPNWHRDSDQWVFEPA